jgi:WD40 repeat protein
VARARAGIHAWIGRAGSGLLHLAPHAILMAMTAAALAPVLLSLLSGGAPVAQQLAGEFGGLGTEHLGYLLEDLVRRLRREGRGGTISEETARNVLERLLEQESVGQHGAALRAEITELLQAVNAVGTTLDAAFRSQVEGLDAHIGQALRVLSETVAEFHWLRHEVLWALGSIQRDINRALMLQQEQGDKLDRVNIQLAMLYRELTVIRPAEPPRPVAEGDPRPVAAVSDICPYPGLAAFNVTDARWFHGRERLTATIVNRLRERLHGTAPLLIVGASGAGKSSVLHAGLIPGLEVGGLAEPGSQEWPQEIMTPGQFPLRDLAIRLGRLAELPASSVLAEISADPARTPLVVRQAVLTRMERRSRGIITVTPELSGHQPPSTSARRLVLVIDQFEEIFTQCRDGTERRLFVEAICAAARGDRGDPAAALVVIGLRAGFVEHCTAHPELEPSLRDQLIVGPMNGHELNAAIEAPARDVGLRVEDGLAQTMLNDLGAVVSPGPGSAATYDPGSLPMLAHALRETWERRADGMLSISAYADTGGISRAIAKKADQVYSAFDANGKRVARLLFLHMVAVREDTEDTRRRMSRPGLLAELPAADQAAADAVLEKLERERLVTADKDTVQIAHEALLRHWPRLSDWLLDNRAWLRLEQQLTDHAHDWDNHGRHPDRLYRADQLSALGEQLDAQRRGMLGEIESAFLDASRRQQARSTRVRETIWAGLVAAVVIVGLLATVAYGDSATARRQQAIAQSGQLAAEADALRSSNPEISLLLSLEAYHIQPTKAAVDSLLTAQSGYFTSRLASGAGAVNAVAYDPGGTLLAGAAQGGVVALWNTADNKRVLFRGDSPFYSVAFAPDTRRPWLAGGEQNGTVVVWDTHRNLAIAAVGRGTDAVNAVAFSPDDSTLASAGDDGAVTLWRTAGWHQRGNPLVVGDGPVNGLAFSPDGKLLAAACADGAVRVWKVAALSAPLLILETAGGPIRAVAFNRGGTELASGGDDGTVRVWDVGSGTLLRELSGGTAAVRTVAFSPDGSQLASGGEDNAVRLWDAATGAQITALSGTANAVSGLAFDPDGHSLAGADADGAVGIWDVPGSPRPGLSPVATAVADRAGTLAIAGTDHGVSLWLLRQRSQLTVNGYPCTVKAPGQAGNPAVGVGLAFSSDGSTLAIPEPTGVQLWNIATCRPTAALVPPSTGVINAVAYQPGLGHGKGWVLAGGSSENALYFWTPSSTKPSGPTTSQLGPINAVAWNPAGTLVASASDDGTVQLTHVTLNADGVTGNPFTSLIGHFAPVDAVAFSPDGATVASASSDQTVRLWHVTGNKSHQIAVLRDHTQTVIGVAFSRDGILASLSRDHTIRLWDSRQGAMRDPLATITVPDSVSGITFAPVGQTVIGATDDGTALFWDTRPQQVAGLFCTAPPAGLKDLLQPYLLGITYQPACPAR